MTSTTRFLAGLFGACILVPACVSTWAMVQPRKVEFVQTACRAIDGDTIDCMGERIRLNGIDAPEKRKCPATRQCVPGDPHMSQRSLEAAMDMGVITYARLGTDRYGRTIGQVKAGETDLSCWQLRVGAALYASRWDNARATKQECDITDTNIVGGLFDE